MCVRSRQPLPSYEGKSSSEFHQKFLQVVDDCRFQLFFGECVVLLEAQELCHDGAFQQFELVRLLFFRRQGGEGVVPLVVLGRDIPVERPHAPHLFRCRFKVPTDGGCVFCSQCFEYMSPSEIWKSRFPNLVVVCYKVEFAE